jgi:hypothetical protein
MELALTNAVERAAAWKDFSPVLMPTTLPEYITYYVHKSYEYVILSPLARLYLHGPSWGGMGFWNGLGLHVICSQKTNLMPEFWQTHPMECIQIVSKSFYSLVVLIETLFYFFFLWIILKGISQCMAQCRKRHQKKDSDNN